MSFFNAAEAYLNPNNWTSNEKDVQPRHGYNLRQTDRHRRRPLPLARPLQYILGPGAGIKRRAEADERERSVRRELNPDFSPEDIHFYLAGVEGQTVATRSYNTLDEDTQDIDNAEAQELEYNFEEGASVSDGSGDEAADAALRESDDYQNFNQFRFEREITPFRETIPELQKVKAKAGIERDLLNRLTRAQRGTRGWPEFHQRIYIHYVCRGFEPIMPITMQRDFVGMKSHVFLRDPNEHAFLGPLGWDDKRGMISRASRALESMMDMPTYIRDLLKTNYFSSVVPEVYAQRTMMKYYEWALQDADIDYKASGFISPLIFLRRDFDTDPDEMHDDMIAALRRLRAKFERRFPKADNPKLRLPPLYGIMTSGGLIYYATLWEERGQHEDEEEFRLAEGLRIIALWDANKDSMRLDGWRGIALAMFCVHSRNHVLDFMGVALPGQVLREPESDLESVGGWSWEGELSDEDQRPQQGAQPQVQRTQQQHPQQQRPQQERPQQRRTQQQQQQQQEQRPEQAQQEQAQVEDDVSDDDIPNYPYARYTMAGALPAAGPAAAQQ